MCRLPRGGSAKAALVIGEVSTPSSDRATFGFEAKQRRRNLLCSQPSASGIGRARTASRPVSICSRSCRVAEGVLTLYVTLYGADQKPMELVRRPLAG